MTSNLSQVKDTKKHLDPEKVIKSIKSTSRFFYFCGGFLILFSLFYLNRLLVGGYINVGLAYNVFVNFILGIGYFICANLLSKRKASVLVWYGCIVVYNVVASILFGNWISIISIIIGIMLLMYIYMLKYQGEIT